MKVDHKGAHRAVNRRTANQAIEAIEEMLARRAGEELKVIEARAEPAALHRSGQCPEAAMEPDRSYKRLEGTFEQLRSANFTR